ncbi:MAG: VanW family protein [Eubacteriales bacterium]|nr:VanW family protein [Eubacteriales bacterium]
MFSQGYQPPSSVSPSPKPAGTPYTATHGKATGNRSSGGAPTGGGRRAPKRRSFGWQLFKLLIVLLALAAAGGGIYVLDTQSDVRPYTSVFVDNVYVDGLSLQGMTWEEGNQAVYQQISDKLTSWYVRLKSTAGEYKDITAQTLGISRDPTQALEAAWAVGHETSSTNRKTIFELKTEIDAARQTKHEFSSVEQSGDTSAIDSILNMLEKAAYVAPQSAALLSFNPDNTSQPFTFQSDVVGKKLNVDAIRAQILAMVETFTTGEVLVQADDVQPSVTLADLQKNYTLRFRTVTPIDSHSTDSRNENIRVAFSRINGKILGDGSKFSFNSVVGKRTLANGFYQAYEYNYGELVPGWGGGVCQASTTVYLAAVQAGMKIVDHTSHSTPVSYTNMGMDATVSDTRGHEVDFAFRNNSGGDIYMLAHVITDPSNKNRLLCEVRIYGLDMGSTSYKLETETVENLAKPTEPEYVEDTDAKYVTYTDEQKTVIEASEGYVVDTYLCTYTDGAQTARVKIARSTYKNRAARIYVGVTPRFVY